MWGASALLVVEMYKGFLRQELQAAITMSGNVPTTFGVAVLRFYQLSDLMRYAPACCFSFSPLLRKAGLEHKKFLFQRDLMHWS